MLFVFCKDSASREERKELARISFPRRRLFYEKIVQAERKTVQAERKMKLLQFFRGAAGFMQEQNKQG